ncbi:Ferredoxin-type protein NapF [Nymphon striatum]|nr:Ferredoxin-type protein NapF [Nymphon striatum]
MRWYMDQINWTEALAATWRARKGQLKPVFDNGLWNLKPNNHVLLWGARGTGKSSLVKAALNSYHDKGLRVIEIAKDDLQYLVDITDDIRSLDYRFIVFCDDLSFEEGETTYKELKSTLQGSIEKPPENVLIVATSNRRHLIPEQMKDNEQSTFVEGEIHHSDTVQEKMSLVDRFGLALSFYPMTQDEYFSIIDMLFTDIKVDDVQQMHVLADRFARERGKVNTRRLPVVVRPPYSVEETSFIETCNRCDDCISACPENIIIRGDGGYPEIDFKQGECTFCNRCADTCHVNAIQRGAKEPWALDISITSKCLSMNAVVCRACGDNCEAQAIRFQLKLGGVSEPQISLDDCTGCDESAKGPKGQEGIQVNPQQDNVISVCGVMVFVHPERRQEVETKMLEITGLEIHGASDEGKLVVTIETDSYKKTGDAVTRLQNVEGILSISMIYQHAESVDEDEMVEFADSTQSINETEQKLES